MKKSKKKFCCTCTVGESKEEKSNNFKKTTQQYIFKKIRKITIPKMVTSAFHSLNLWKKHLQFFIDKKI